MTTRSTSEDTSPAEGPKKGNRTHVFVLVGLFAASSVIAVVAYGKFTRSEQMLQRDFDAIKVEGADLSVDGCVDRVMEWHAGCEAMKVLCDRSVGRMMEMCLDGADRRGYCATIADDETTATTFGFQECKDRGAHETRALKKVCGTTYRAVSAHCQRLEQLATAERTSTEGVQ